MDWYRYDEVNLYSNACFSHLDERIRVLEVSIHRLQEHMTGVRDEVHVISKTLYTKVGRA